MPLPIVTNMRERERCSLNKIFLLLTITCAPRNKAEAKSEGSQIGRPCTSQLH